MATADISERKITNNRKLDLFNINSKPAIVKANWKPLPNSLDHSVKGYADDAMLISATHSYVV